jgi:hypothetical protein
MCTLHGLPWFKFFRTTHEPAKHKAVRFAGLSSSGGGIRTRDLRVMRSPGRGLLRPVPPKQSGSGALRSAQIRSTWNHEWNHGACRRALPICPPQAPPRSGGCSAQRSFSSSLDSQPCPHSHASNSQFPTRSPASEARGARAWRRRSRYLLEEAGSPPGACVAVGHGEPS